MTTGLNRTAMAAVRAGEAAVYQHEMDFLWPKLGLPDSKRETKSGMRCRARPNPGNKAADGPHFRKGPDAWHHMPPGWMVIDPYALPAKGGGSTATFCVVRHPATKLLSEFKMNYLLVRRRCRTLLYL